MELVEIWVPQRGHPVPDVLCRGVWMKRWLETHRTQYTDAVCTALCRTNWVGMRKAARDALSARLTARPARLTQLAFAFDDTS